MYLHHKGDHEFPRGTPVRTVYVVCSVPRSGSSLLCELLMNTELAGAPTEYLDPNMRDGFMHAWGLGSFASYIEALLDRKTSPNGVFGLKMHHGNFVDNRGDPSVDALLRRAKFVYIRRRDRLGQAISYSRAVQTEQWASVHPVPDCEPEFNYEEIRGLLQRVHDEEAGWERFFAERGATPFRVDYEDFIEDMNATTVAALRFLGVEEEPAADLAPPTLEKQADQVNEEWRQRYELIANRQGR